MNGEEGRRFRSKPSCRRWTADFPVQFVASGAAASGLRRKRTVEFQRELRYSDHANAFVRQVLSVFAPAGGEMSGLTAHFLFGANLKPDHTGTNKH
jgi:hypothetical protein